MYNLPKGYLSYSAYIMWIRSKDSFRKKYYLGIDDFKNKETIFGKKIDKHLEEGGVIEGVEKYHSAQHQIEVEIEPGLKILGYLDDFDEETLSILEVKTGHTLKSGKAPWDNIKVRKHKQLVYYALLVYLKYGKYNPKVKLTWLETDFENTTYDFAGYKLSSDDKELKLTGKVETFERYIEQWELDRLKEDIKRVAKEITQDYESFQNKESIR